MTTRPDDLLAYASNLLGYPIRTGMWVRVHIETSGDDHEDNYHEVPANSLAQITSVDWYSNHQGLAITLWIPVSPDNLLERGIVNVFDEADDVATRFAFSPVPSKQYEAALTRCVWQSATTYFEIPADVDPHQHLTNVLAEGDLVIWEDTGDTNVGSIGIQELAS